jgi:hypothetical protein
MISQSFSDPARWAELQVGDARLMNKRRSRRAVKIVRAMAENPGLSIARLFSSWGDCKSASGVWPFSSLRRCFFDRRAFFPCFPSGICLVV